MKNITVYNKNGLKKKLTRYVIVGASVVAITGAVTSCMKKNSHEAFLDNLEDVMTRIRVESVVTGEKNASDYYGDYNTGYVTPERFEKAFTEENGSETLEEGETAVIPVLLDANEVSNLADYLSRGKNIQLNADIQNYDNFTMNESDYMNFLNYESYTRIPATTYYTVQSGEWLEEIAAKFKTSLSNITYSNGEMIQNKDVIRDGEVLKINTYQHVLDEMENEVIAQKRANR